MYLKQNDKASRQKALDERKINSKESLKYMCELKQLLGI